MTVVIRRASVDDAQSIAEIKRCIWPTEESDPRLISSVLGQPSHVTLVAVLDSTVIGFVDGFLTVAADGTRRWEVDMLGVHPHYRGGGIAMQLVASSTSAGQLMGAAVARGLVGLENIASERTFARCGYAKDGEVCKLYISSAAISSRRPPPKDAHLVPVTTLNYHGLWLEGTLSLAAFTAVQAIRTHDALDVVGAVIPDSQGAAIQAACDAGFILVGAYRWWQLDLHKS